MKILFQGDSVTDAGRDRNHLQDLGNGYVSVIANKLMRAGAKHELCNTAIAGNRVGDMYARWIEDTLNRDFEVLSVLCGVNDIGFQLRRNCGADAEKFRFIYDRMLEEVRKQKGNVQLVLMEPFIFKVNLEDIDMRNRNDIYDQYDVWSGYIREESTIVRELAEKYNAVFVPLMDKFEVLSEKNGADAYSADGIHPNLRGHKVIAEEWLRACSHVLDVGNESIYR